MGLEHSQKEQNITRAAQALFILNAAIWVVLGIAGLLRQTAIQPVQPIVALVVTVLMFANAGAMLLAGVGLGQRRKLFDYFAIAVIVVNIILTITDQFGVLDLAMLVIDVILLGLLVAIVWRLNRASTQR